MGCPTPSTQAVPPLPGLGSCCASDTYDGQALACPQCPKSLQGGLLVLPLEVDRHGQTGRWAARPEEGGAASGLGPSSPTALSPTPLTVAEPGDMSVTF